LLVTSKCLLLLLGEEGLLRRLLLRLLLCLQAGRHRNRC
jgi:hypothetical protein